MIENQAVIQVDEILTRLEDDTYNDSDICMLFVTLRDMAGASAIIKEAGNFIAHSTTRERGTLNEIMLRNHLLLNIIFGYDKELVKPHMNEYPKHFDKLVKLQLRVQKKAHLRKKLGLNKVELQRSLKILNNEASYISRNGICSLAPDITDVELAIIDEIMSTLHCNDAIDFDSLINDVTLMVKKIVPQSNSSIVGVKRKSIFCVLLCKMNNVEFKLLSGSVAHSFVSLELNDGKVFLNGIYDVIGPKKDVKVASPLFVSEFKIDEIFENDVSDADIRSGNIIFRRGADKITRRKKLSV